MIVNDKYKFVYQHIPKTGGTFLSHVLCQYLNTCTSMDKYSLKWYANPEEVEAIEKIIETQPGAAAHMEFRQLQENIVKSYKLLLSIRHPIDRILSLYADLHFNTFSFVHDKQYKEAPNIRVFIERQTKDFDPLHSTSRKIDNAIRTAGKYAGCEILKFETMKYDALRALFNLEVPVGQMFFRDLMVNGGTTDLLNGVAKSWRKTPSSTKNMIAEVFYSDKALCEKYYDYEKWTIDRFYTPTWRG